MNTNENTTPATQAPEKKKKKKPLVIILIIIAVLLIVSIAAVSIASIVGKNAMHDYDDMTVTPSPEATEVESVDNNGKTINYKGETYNFNEDVTTVLLMGIDETDYEYTERKDGEGGYADAIYIAVIDTENDKVTILNVPRNTMVDVDFYDKNDKFVETKEAQICLAHTSFDGKEDSINNTIVSLERLFGGIKFDTYFVMNQDAVEDLNDSIGGVTLTPTVSFYSVNEHRYIEPGSEFTLKGHDSVMYIRSREWDDSKLLPDENRVNRQIQYMNEFMDQTWSAVKNDSKVIEDMYKTVEENTVTNLDVSKLTYLATTVVTDLDSYKEIEYVTLPGDTKKSVDYHKYYVDEDGVMKLIVDLFYEKAE